MMKKIISLIIISVVLQVLVVMADEHSAPIKVACIGDSITFGAGIVDRDKNSYPSQLGKMLGDDYQVENFGVSSATILKNGDEPYSRLNQFINAMTYQPNIVIIKLGTNDTKPDNWKYHRDFESNYIEMVKAFQGLDSRPEVWVCFPMPAFSGKWGINDQTIRTQVIPHVEAVAARTGSMCIDLYSPLIGKSELVPDTVHPNAAGAKIIAETVFESITRKKSKPKVRRNEIRRHSSDFSNQ